MSTFEILIGAIIGMVIAFYSHDYWCIILKKKQMEKLDKKELK